MNGLVALGIRVNVEPQSVQWTREQIMFGFQKTRTTLGLLSVWVLCSSPVQATDVQISVAEPTGVNRRSWPVTSGIPFASGALLDANRSVLISADNRELPLQTEVLSRWQDGSVRWLLLDFAVDLRAGEHSGARRVVLARPGRVARHQRPLPLPGGHRSERPCRCRRPGRADPWMGNERARSFDRTAGDDDRHG